jgi:hypothetical protein
MVMGDYNKIKSLDFLKEMYKIHQAKKSKQKKELKYKEENINNSMLEDDPQFSSDEEHRDVNIKGKEKEKMKFYNSNEHEEDLSSGLGEAFFSDEDQNILPDKIPSNNSEDEDDMRIIEEKSEKKSDYAEEIQIIESKPKKKISKKNQKIRDLDFDWI